MSFRDDFVVAVVVSCFGVASFSFEVTGSRTSTTGGTGEVGGEVFEGGDELGATDEEEEATRIATSTVGLSIFSPSSSLDVSLFSPLAQEDVSLFSFAAFAAASREFPRGASLSETSWPASWSGALRGMPVGENLLGLEDCKDVGIKVRLLRRGGNKPGVEGELGGDEGDLDVPFSIFFFFSDLFSPNLSLSFLLGGLSCVGGRV